MSIKVNAYCNLCGGWYEDYTLDDNESFVSTLKESGWLIENAEDLNNAEAYCPDCIELYYQRQRFLSFTKEIPGVEGYRATENGHICTDFGRLYLWRHKKWGYGSRQLKESTDVGGYKRVSIPAIRKSPIAVHRLVCAAYHGTPIDDERNCVDHVNGIRSDNRPSNLRWVSHKENMANVHSFGELVVFNLEGEAKLIPSANCTNRLPVRRTFDFLGGTCFEEDGWFLVTKERWDAASSINELIEEIVDEEEMYDLFEGDREGLCGIYPAEYFDPYAAEKTKGSLIRLC